MVYSERSRRYVHCLHYKILHGHFLDDRNLQLPPFPLLHANEEDVLAVAERVAVEGVVVLVRPRR